jgi:hypothetical protein
MCSELENTELIERELAVNGVYASNTRGASMEPLFKTHRDMVIIKRAERELKKYDVALYKDTHGRYVLHRVIKVLCDFYIIRGDNTFVNEKVPKSAVIGVLISFRNKQRRKTVEDKSYKLYSRFWHFIYPVRYLFHKSKLVLHKIYRTVFKKKTEN